MLGYPCATRPPQYNSNLSLMPAAHLLNIGYIPFCCLHLILIRTTLITPTTKVTHHSTTPNTNRAVLVEVSLEGTIIQEHGGGGGGGEGGGGENKYYDHLHNSCVKFHVIFKLCTWIGNTIITHRQLFNECGQKPSLAWTPLHHSYCALQVASCKVCCLITSW